VDADQGPVTYAVDGAVATITMGTASLGLAAKQALLAAVTEAGGDDGVRAVVLTGTGRVFTAGQDLREHADALREAGADAFGTIEAHYNPLITALATMAKPVLAAINGTCAGAGLGLALACDLRIAAQEARFTTAFTGIGLVPDSGLSASLARAVGTARASELIILSTPFTAEDALSWGIVGRLVPAGDLAAAAQEMASRLAAGPTLAYAAAKRAIRQAWAAPWPDVLAAEARDQAALGATADHRGAVDAFLAKRQPEFRGRE
jgi:2-(1,2-epoxy-1,2-dihydrophenyl)acetyl-CoA isomerase